MNIPRDGLWDYENPNTKKRRMKNIPRNRDSTNSPLPNIAQLFMFAHFIKS